MKKILFLVCLMPYFVQSQTAMIQIDCRRAIAEINPAIYGVFMEPIHMSGKRMGLPDSVSYNTLYGTVYNPKSVDADKNGFSKEYIDAMRELKINNMRWPGGNFLMGYDWKDGIGDKRKRPVRINLAWGGSETNQVGTDEWFQLNKSIGSENILCVNLGLGSIADACYWLEYCNYPKGTYYSDLRAANGHPEPYRVKIVDLGNEVDGEPWELGHKTADEYVNIGREAVKALKSVDDKVRFVASGSSHYKGDWVEWNQKVLEGMGDVIDYLSIHRYWEKSTDYYGFMGESAMDFEEKIKIPAAQIELARVRKGFTNPVYLSVDEWGIMSKDFQSVLSVAQCFNSFIRHADVVKMANFTMLTTLLSADKTAKLYKTPLFYIFKAYSNRCYGSSVDTHVVCDTFQTAKCKNIPYLDVTTVYSPEQHVAWVNVVNRHKDRAIEAAITSVSDQFSGQVGVEVINQEDIQRTFSYENREQYQPVKDHAACRDNKIIYTFPAHSFVQLKIELK